MTDEPLTVSRWYNANDPEERRVFFEALGKALEPAMRYYVEEQGLLEAAVNPRPFAVDSRQLWVEASFGAADESRTVQLRIIHGPPVEVEIHIEARGGTQTKRVPGLDLFSGPHRAPTAKD